MAKERYVSRLDDGKGEEVDMIRPGVESLAHRGGQCEPCGPSTPC
jgi:hypothetical protein